MALRGVRVLAMRPDVASLGRDPELLDPFLTQCLKTRGRWSDQPIVADLLRERYDLVFEKTGGNPVFRNVGYWSRNLLAAVG